MKQYFEKKLKSIVQDIERTKDNIIKYANELDIKSIIEATDRLKSLTLKQSEFTKDACINLTIVEAIELMNLKLIREYDATSIYQYEKAVTTTERDMLVRVSHRFSLAKIK